MADFNALEALINAYIKQNGVQAITGQVLNGVLRGMVSALGKGWTVAGEAYPNTDPGTMTGPVAYVAHTAGTYTNFGGLVVNDGEVAFLKYNEQTWTKEVLASLAATASVDGNVGTPYVVTQFVNGVLNFAFHNMKGDPGINGTDGQDGAAAGFGTVNATVDGNVGTPGVSVQSSGPDTAKNFTFQFTNLKGETGVTSVVVTVDNTSGNPQCTASLNAGVLTLAFTGLKGAQGDTGSSVDYPFTLVNNLTTNDATQALTAAMGVQLESEITQLEAEVDELPLDASKLASIVIGGTIETSWGWWGTSVSIPSGSVVRNAGTIDVNLYEIKGNGNSNHISVNAGTSVTTTFPITGIRGVSVVGSFKLFVYGDAGLFSSINSIQSISADLLSVETSVDEIKEEIVRGGLFSFSHSMSSYINYTLPKTIPADTHFVVMLDSNDYGITVVLNSGLADEKTFLNVHRFLELRPSYEVKRIKISISAELSIFIINDSLMLPNNTVGTDEIKDNSITNDKIVGEHIASANLYDKEKSDDGYYINQLTGGLVANANYTASDFIPVKGGEKYCCSPNSGQYALYDGIRQYVSGGGSLSSPLTIPSGIEYIRISVLVDNKKTTIFNHGNSSLPYVPYYRKVRNTDIIAGVDNESFANSGIGNVVCSRLWNGIVKNTSGSLSNGASVTLDDYPKSFMKGDKISLYAKVTSWNEGITIGKGETDYNSAYAVIDGTNIVLKSYANGTETTHGTVVHGMSFSSFVKVVIDISSTKWKFILQTLDKTFLTEINCHCGNGTPRITSNGAILTEVVLSCTNSDFARPIWMFGDSYFGIRYNNRELYWLNEWGYLNVLVQGFSGQNSSHALPDLQKCIAISKPKYIVWALGMNDNVSLASWQSYVSSVKTICSQYGIELILCTIPQPLNLVSYKYKDDMSDWIRNDSGCRYIDVAKAVGSNDDGEWYGYGEDYDYQSTDNVHPSMYGAEAIATQFLTDFPEIMQY